VSRWGLRREDVSRSSFALRATADNLTPGTGVKVGGGGGSRTRVRKYGVEGLYMRIRFVIFMPGVWKRLSTTRP